MWMVETVVPAVTRWAVEAADEAEAREVALRAEQGLGGAEWADSWWEADKAQVRSVVVVEEDETRYLDEQYG